VEILHRAGEGGKNGSQRPLPSDRSTNLDREEPSVDEQTSQQNEDTYSTRVDEPEPVEQSDDEWLADDEGEH